MSCECNRDGRNYYNYYDTPDGCDIDKKVMVTTRYGIIAGIVISTYDVLMYSHDIGVGRILSRYASHIIPLGLMGATFALAANGALHAREKDDRWNYFLGGLACGPILGYYLKSRQAIFVGGVVLGAIGIVKKDVVDMGGRFFPEHVHRRRMLTSWKNDWTLAADPRDTAMQKCVEMSSPPPPPPPACKPPPEDRCDAK